MTPAVIQIIISMHIWSRNGSAVYICYMCNVIKHMTPVVCLLYGAWRRCRYLHILKQIIRAIWIRIITTCLCEMWATFRLLPGYAVYVRPRRLDTRWYCCWYLQFVVNHYHHIYTYFICNSHLPSSPSPISHLQFHLPSPSLIYTAIPICSTWPSPLSISLICICVDHACAPCATRYRFFFNKSYT